MLKPNDFDQVAAYGEFTPLELGGHICQILNIEESKSNSGKDMLIISLDTAPQDKQPGYYMQQWRNDTRDNKKWGCRVFQLVYDNDGKTNSRFKAFVTAVERSNPGFQVQWGDRFCDCFKNALVGGVFGREQYQNSSGELKWSTKCIRFSSVEAVQNGIEPPKEKYLSRCALKMEYQNSFTELDTEGDLPF